MLKIAICDDEKVFVEETKEKIESYLEFAHSDLTYQINRFCSGEDLIASMEENTFDIIFLDIMMDGINGIETAKKIAPISPETMIVFISSSKEYALDAYEVNAFYYLTKPLSNEKFALVFEKCMGKIASLDNSYLAVRGTDGVNKVYLRDIVYCFTSGHKLNLLLKDGTKLICYMKMAEFFSACAGDKRFLQTHKSFAVNLDYVKMVSQKDSKVSLYHSDDIIPISRDYKAAVMEKYMKYVF